MTANADLAHTSDKPTSSTTNLTAHNNSQAQEYK
jgi:hypothetical protein